MPVCLGVSMRDIGKTVSNKRPSSTQIHSLPPAPYLIILIMTISHLKSIIIPDRSVGRNVVYSFIVMGCPSR